MAGAAARRIVFPDAAYISAHSHGPNPFLGCSPARSLVAPLQIRVPSYRCLHFFARSCDLKKSAGV